MTTEAIKRGMIGIGFGGLITFIALTVCNLQAVEISLSKIWLHMLGSILLGAFFGVASLLFEKEAWSPLKQYSVHFILTVAVFFSVAISIGWVPLKPVAIIIAFGVFTVIYLVIWFFVKWRLKRLEASMNDSIR